MRQPLSSAKRLYMRKSSAANRRRLIPSGSRADFEQHVFFIVGILGHEQELQVLLAHRRLFLESLEFFLRHGAHLGIGLGMKHAFGIFDVMQKALVFPELLHDLAQVAMRLGIFLV